MLSENLRQNLIYALERFRLNEDIRTEDFADDVMKFLDTCVVEVRPPQIVELYKDY